ncbi:MAG: macro domain-containing protein [Lachnospiraceae bacterium]|nr:macro domain-containing protein [Lachnospiraceae bacterium]
MPFKIVRDDISNIKADTIIDIEKEISTANYECTNDNCKIDNLKTLRNCYDDSLKQAAEHGYKSIAFPLVSSGDIGFTKEVNLKTAFSAFSDFLQKEDMEIILVVSDKDSFGLSGKLYPGIDEYISENLIAEPGDALISQKEINEYDANYACDESLEAFEDEECEEAPVESPKREPGFFDRFFTAAKVTSSARKEKKAEKGRIDFENASCESMSLSDRVKHLADTWQESLLKLIDDKGYTDIEVYKRANVDRKLFSKIRSNPSYQPKKITAVAFALALKLSLDDTKDFIGRAGYAFSPSSIFDLIIEYFIEQEVYDTYTINLALFEHEQPLLGE